MGARHVPRRWAGSQFAGVLLTGLILTVFTACQPGPGAPDDSTPGTVTPQTTYPPTPAPTSDADRWGEPVETSPGEVTIRPAEDRFRAGQPIVATIGNGTTGNLFVENLHTGCTIGVLQRHETKWVSLPDCEADRLAAVLAIAPGHGRSIFMDLGNTLPAGTYRIAVGWRTTPGPAGTTEQQTYSGLFQVLG